MKKMVFCWLWKTTAFERTKRQKTQQGLEYKVIDVDSLLSSTDYLGDVPTQEEMAQILLEEKRKSLLSRLNF